ncbi:MAG: hypothetical protein M3Q97_03260, partial [Bacteroidota bacterium]|nr:hypothetical protein [Bacteroidota bacterium]
MRIFLTLLIITISIVHVSAQQEFEWKSTPGMNFPIGGTVRLDAAEIDYFPVLRSLEMPKPGGS